MASDEAPPPVEDLSNSDVVEKYKLAGGIAAKAMEGVQSQLADGKSVLELCAFGDLLVVKQCEGIFKKKKTMEKGVAFPTCISVNEVVCHFSPLDASEDVVLKTGDVVKIDLGAHIDGYVAVLAETRVVGVDAVPAGPLCDVIAAAKTAAVCGVNVMKEGATSSDVTAAMKRAADAFGVHTAQGVLSHRMKRFVMDGQEAVIEREEPDQATAEFTFEKNGVYTVDVVMTTSEEGKPVQVDQRTTVYKRALDRRYQLKGKKSRAFLSEVQTKFPSFPFTLRAMEDPMLAKAGVVECVKHELLESYPVLVDAKSSQVAHFKYTVLLTARGPVRLTANDVLVCDVSAADDKLTEELTKLRLDVTPAKAKKAKK